MGSRGMHIDPPVFTKSRFARRWNMGDEDRLKWYNWNLACIALTAVPFVWMYTVNYQTSEDTAVLIRCLNPTGTEKVKYDLKLYGSRARMRRASRRLGLGGDALTKVPQPLQPDSSEQQK